MGSRPAIDDERELATELLTDATGGGAFRQTEEVGGGGRDGEAEALDHCAGDGGVGDAEGEVAGVGRDTQRQLRASFDDKGEWTGPEALGEAVEGGVELAGEFVGLRNLGDEERQGLVAGAGFEVIDALNGAEIDGVDCEAVEGTRGKRDYVATVEAADNLINELGLWFVGMDEENFSRQIWLLCSAKIEIVRWPTDSHHSIPPRLAQLYEAAGGKASERETA
jgi:hypothetical protein